MSDAMILGLKYFVGGLLVVQVPAIAFATVTRILELTMLLKTPKGITLSALILLTSADSAIRMFSSYPPLLNVIPLSIELALLPMLVWRFKKELDPSPPNLQSMEGKVVLITGGNTGIGFGTALELAKLGSQIVIGSRDAVRGNAAVKKINEEVGSELASFLELDLNGLSNVKRFAETFKGKYDRLDVLINNAGLVPSKFELTKDGYEYGFGTMHLGHFLLTAILMPMLIQSSGRVITVSSFAQKFATREEFSDFRNPIPLTMNGYARAKLANYLVTVELHRRSQGKIHAFSMHPGSVFTSIWDWKLIYMRYYGPVLNFWFQMLTRNWREGAVDLIFCAASRDALKYSGQNLCNFKPFAVNPLARDEAFTAKFFKDSEEMVKGFM